MKWYLKVLRQYFDFKGRARRKEYWMFVLFNIVFSLVASLFGILAVIYGVALFIPGLAVSVRRLHDVGKSGWWLLISLTVIGVFWLIYLSCIDSQQGSNKWGDNPKEISN
jgi:uncharacterized membrane protein YhaH (DUF805 family)